MYLTTKETQAKLRVSRETVRQLIKAGELDAHKVGDAPNSPLRISEESIQRYVASHAVVPDRVPVPA